MKRARQIIILSILFAAVTAAVTAQSSTDRPLANVYALGHDNDCGGGDYLEGWTVNQYITPQVCPKGPAPPDGMTSGGAAFKTGPVSGTGQAGQTAVMYQTFSASDLTPAETYTATMKTMIISVASGGAYLEATLYGRHTAGDEWENLAALLTYEQGQTTPCNTLTLWDTYCGEPAIVPAMGEYKVEFTAVYYGAVSTLGVKWTGIDFTMIPISAHTPPAETPTPTAEPTPPLPIMIPLMLGETAVITSDGCTLKTAGDGDQITIICE